MPFNTFVPPSLPVVTLWWKWVPPLRRARRCSGSMQGCLVLQAAVLRFFLTQWRHEAAPSQPWPAAALRNGVPDGLPCWGHQLCCAMPWPHGPLRSKPDIQPGCIIRQALYSRVVSWVHCDGGIAGKTHLALNCSCEASEALDRVLPDRTCCNVRPGAALLGAEGILHPEAGECACDQDGGPRPEPGRAQAAGEQGPGRRACA